MSKTSTNRRRQVSDQKLTDSIKSAAKSVFEAKRTYEKLWRSALEPLAVEIGYESPKAASKILLEELDERLDGIDSPAVQQIEAHLIDQVRMQQLSWRKSELLGKIKELEDELLSIKSEGVI